MFTYNPQQQLFIQQNGKLQQTIFENQTIYIKTKSFSVLQITSLKSAEFIQIEREQVYKFQEPQKLVVYGQQYNYLYIYTFPLDLSIHIFKDENLLEVYNAEGNKCFFEDINHVYITVKSYTKQYYLSFNKFFSTSVSYLLYPATIILSPVLLQIDSDQIIKTLMFIAPNEQQLSIDYQKNDSLTTVIQMDNFEQFICILNLGLNEIKQIFQIQYQEIDNQSIYLIYLQENDILIYFDQYVSQLQLEILIENTNVNTISKISKIQNNFIDWQHSLESKLLYRVSGFYQKIDMNFFQCQGILIVLLEYDCIFIVRTSEIAEPNMMSFQTCVDVPLGIVELQNMFFCQPIESLEIFALAGKIQIYSQDRFVRCMSQICYVLFKKTSQTLQYLQEQSKFVFTLNYNSLNFNIVSSFEQYLIYINQTQSVFIHSNNEFQLASLSNDQSEFKNQYPILSEGYYFIRQTNHKENYLTIFTYPTLLYDKILFTVVNKDQFTILLNLTNYLVLEANSSFKYSLDNKEYQQNVNNTQIINILELRNNIITFQSNSKVRAHYIRKPCYFQEEPRLYINNRSIYISAQVNKKCQQLEIMLMTNSSQVRLQSQEIDARVDELFRNELQNNLEKQLNYQIIIVSKEFIYSFTYSNTIHISNVENNIHNLILFIVIIILLKVIVDKQKLKITYKDEERAND